ncbi:MAG: LTA synthase family protein, partial [Desulfobacteraceae bacterium]|nr:LTA synthase family protein [Desulfobacteraceae bacterium]
MKNRLSLFFLSIPCFTPMIWRLFHQGFFEPIGLLSDGVSGLILFLTALLFPHWLRIILLAAWALFQAGAWELFGAMQRFPAWQDMHYLADPSFVEKSTAGFHLIYPWLTVSLFAAIALACFSPAKRPGRKFWFKGIALAACL